MYDINCKTPVISEEKKEMITNDKNDNPAIINTVNVI